MQTRLNLTPDMTSQEAKHAAKEVLVGVEISDLSTVPELPFDLVELRNRNLAIHISFKGAHQLQNLEIYPGLWPKIRALFRKKSLFFIVIQYVIGK